MKPNSEPTILHQGGACAALVLGALLGSGCSDGSSDGRPVQADRTLFSLLDRADRLDILREDEDRPVQLDVFQPSGSRVSGLPALVMAPTSEVRVRLPSTPPNARLEFATGVRRRTHAGHGAVIFTIEVGGEPVFENEVDSSEGLPPEERRWFPASIPLQGARSIVLRTRYEGDSPDLAVGGFAQLDVVVAEQVLRTKATKTRPNVLLVVIDTLRADGLSAYGSPRSISPTLDALAERGTLYERAYASVSWTSPSTASILTSLSPPEHGVGPAGYNLLPSSLTTLSEVFANAGFIAAGFSANPLVTAARGFDQGFESFGDYGWQDTSRIAADIRAFVDSTDGERFFLYLHLVDPHGPYLPPARFAPFVGPAPEGYTPSTLSELRKKIWRKKPKPGDNLEAMGRHLRDLYDGEIASVDDALGGIFEHLETLGILDETVIAVTSDHGEEFLDHGLLGHNFQLHEETVRVPLIIAGPGVPRGQKVEQRIENRFVSSTLARLAGVQLTGGLDGPNLLDEGDLEVLEGRPIFFSSTAGHLHDAASDTWSDKQAIHGVLAGERLLFWAPEAELAGDHAAVYFDLRDDPKALTDCAEQHTSDVAELRLLIAGWLAHGARTRLAPPKKGTGDLELLQGLGYIGDDE